MMANKTRAGVSLGNQPQWGADGLVLWPPPRQMRRQVDGGVPGDKYKQQSGTQRRSVACFINKLRQISRDFHQESKQEILLLSRELQFPSGGSLVGSNSLDTRRGFVFDPL